MKLSRDQQLLAYGVAAAADQQCCIVKDLRNGELNTHDMGLSVPPGFLVRMHCPQSSSTASPFGAATLVDSSRQPTALWWARPLKLLWRTCPHVTHPPCILHGRCLTNVHGVCGVLLLQVPYSLSWCCLL